MLKFMNWMSSNVGVTFEVVNDDAKEKDMKMFQAAVQD